MRRTALVVLVLASLLVACSDDDGDAASDATTTGSTGGGLPTRDDGAGRRRARLLVFNGQGNNLDAYDRRPGRSPKQIVDPNHDDDPRRASTSTGRSASSPTDPGRFIAGEDTGQPDPPAGWGIFELTGATARRPRGRAGRQAHADLPDRATPENYGCGFLSRRPRRHDRHRQPGERAARRPAHHVVPAVRGHDEVPLLQDRRHARDGRQHLRGRRRQHLRRVGARRRPRRRSGTPGRSRPRPTPPGGCGRTGSDRRADGRRGAARSCSSRPTSTCRPRSR